MFSCKSWLQAGCSIGKKKSLSAMEYEVVWNCIFQWHQHNMKWWRCVRLLQSFINITTCVLAASGRPSAQWSGWTYGKNTTFSLRVSWEDQCHSHFCLFFFQHNIRMESCRSGWCAGKWWKMFSANWQSSVTEYTADRQTGGVSLNFIYLHVVAPLLQCVCVEYKIVNNEAIW